MQELKLNPCKACVQKYGIKDINALNSCCYSTVAAFAGQSSVNAIRDSPEARNCVACIGQSKRALGRDDCDLRLTAAAVWSEVPHYFPDLVQTEPDPKKALGKCVDMCKNSPYPNECRENCVIDYDSIEQYKKTKKHMQESHVPAPFTPPADKTQYLVSYVLASLVFLFILVVFLQVLFYKKK